MKQAKWFLLLHVILGIYAGSSVCSKLAAQQPFLSAAFIVLYGLMLLVILAAVVVNGVLDTIDRRLQARLRRA